MLEGHDGAAGILTGFFAVSADEMARYLPKKETIVKPITPRAFGVDKGGLKHNDRCVVLYVLHKTIEQAESSNHEHYAKARAGLIKAFGLFGQETGKDMSSAIAYIEKMLPMKRWIQDDSVKGYHENPEYNAPDALAGMNWIADQAKKAHVKFLAEFKNYVPCHPTCDNPWNTNHKFNRPVPQHHDYEQKGGNGYTVINGVSSKPNADKINGVTFVDVTPAPKLWYELMANKEPVAPFVAADVPWYIKMANAPVVFKNPTGLDAYGNKELAKVLHDIIQNPNWLTSMSTWLQVELNQNTLDVLRSRAQKEGWNSVYDVVMAYRKWQTAAQLEALTA